MNCKIAMDLTELYLDGLVSEESAAEIREHLRSCPACRKYYKSFEKNEDKLSFFRCSGTKDAEMQDHIRKQYAALSKKLRRRHYLEIAGSSAAIATGTVMLTVGIILICKFHPFQAD